VAFWNRRGRTRQEEIEEEQRFAVLEQDRTLAGARVKDIATGLVEHGNEKHTPDMVAVTGDQTVAGVKTFSSFPVTPSAAPTTNYQAANKKYVDDSAGAGVATDAIWDALGDLIYGTGADTGVKLTGNTTTTKKFLTQTGDGAVSAAPAWGTIIDADIPAAIARDAEIVPAVEAEATLDLTGAVTIAAGKSLATDTIAEKTAATGVTIDGSTIKDFVFYPDPTGHPAATVGCVGANFYFSYDGNNYIILFGATPKWSMAVGGNAILELLATTIDAKTHKIVNLAAATANGDAMRFDETPKLAGDLEGTVAAPTVKAASLTVAGKVEIATAAETTTGTDAGRAVSPDGLAGSDYGKRIMYIYEVVPAATALTTGDSKVTFAIPIEITGWNLVRAEARVHTVGTGATLIAIQIRNATDGHDMLSTKITIDASELTSYTAATPSVVDTNEDDVVTADIIAIDIDAINNTVVALGLDVILTWQLP